MESSALVRAERLAGAFAARYARLPDGVWMAPGRANLIGEHTDYNDGFVLPIALDRTTLAAVAVRPDGIARVSSTSAGDVGDIAVADVAPGAVSGWSAVSYTHLTLPTKRIV